MQGSRNKNKTFLKDINGIQYFLHSLGTCLPKLIRTWSYMLDSGSGGEEGMFTRGWRRICRRRKSPERRARRRAAARRTTAEAGPTR